MDAWWWLPPSRFIWGSSRPAVCGGASTSGHTSACPPGPSLFFDARNLTAAWECQRLGHDPLFDNPCDPWRRPLMYLRPWLLLGVLGLDQSHTVALSVVLVAAMFVSFFVLVGRVPARNGHRARARRVFAGGDARRRAGEHGHRAVLAGGGLCAHVARLPGSCPDHLSRWSSCWSPPPPRCTPCSRCRLSSAAGSRVAARVALLCIAVFAAYLLVSLRDVRHVAAIATQGDEFSYGARILIAHLYHQVGADTLARTCDRQTTDRRDPDGASRGSDRDSGPSTF